MQVAKKHERYCFVFDDILIMAKRTNIGTLFSEPSSAFMFLTKRTKSKFRNDRKEISWTSIAGAGTVSPTGDDEIDEDSSFQYQRYCQLFNLIGLTPTWQPNAYIRKMSAQCGRRRRIW